jgi:hypothetical protein
MGTARRGLRPHTRWVDCPPTRAEAWLQEHEQDLLGLAADDAAALIEGAGLRIRVREATGGWITQEQRNDRISVQLDDAETVRSADAG